MKKIHIMSFIFLVLWMPMGLMAQEKEQSDSVKNELKQEQVINKQVSKKINKKINKKESQDVNRGTNDGFIASKGIKKESVSAEKMVIISYVSFFVLILGFLLFISRRMSLVSKKLAKLELLYKNEGGFDDSES